MFPPPHKDGTNHARTQASKRRSEASHVTGGDHDLQGLTRIGDRRTAGRGSAYTADDGWTMRTIDGRPAAHYEHAIVITRGNPIVLTA